MLRSRKYPSSYGNTRVVTIGSRPEIAGLLVEAEELVVSEVHVQLGQHRPVL